VISNKGKHLIIIHKLLLSEAAGHQETSSSRALAIVISGVNRVSISHPLLSTFGFEWKHALDPQFLCGYGYRHTNRRDERKIRKTLAAFYESDRQYRTMSPWNRA
jgi:hypothetical protein